MFSTRFNTSHLAAAVLGAVTSMLLVHALPSAMASQDKDSKKPAARSAEEPDEEGDEEESVDIAKLPEPVRTAAQKYFTNLAACKATSENEHGAQIFEIVGKGEGGRELSLNVTASGTVFEIEREVAQESLPAEVRATLTKQFSGATLGKAEAVEQHYFEIHMVKDGKKSGVRVSCAGPVMQSKKSEEK